MFRNREFRRFVLVFTLIAAIFTALGFAISAAAGILSLAAAAAFATAFFVFTKTRYQNIARISDQIDLVLHNAEHLFISDSEEGELSILSSEIQKMTLRIREQNDILKKEKEHLAESLADIAHQLRTPLTSISLILSLLDSCSDEKERKAFVREAEELLVQMDWLLTSLLKLSRLDAGVVVFQCQQVDVRKMISAALRPLAISMELRDIDLTVDVPEGMVIEGDSGWLSEAVQNIIKNCMESAGEKGTIQIHCADNPLFAQITIRGSGKGFEKEDLLHLFDRFYRGKSENASGYGIGLALCKTILTRQGGAITAKNHPQGGAVFIIRFPK
ncbi:HAMP domain-containing histidine kinase [Clostridiales Family XIII bacterium ASD5510]|uniref:histidine kinase n=1 Tax=Hominibacterium faecale TaxID=2839743 RepID=A0A9J6QP45_9FIRM|nr:HAMP domain-containing sensor histidine kinase [Hominibacterium faecale]MCU7377196.1 HAMP domain-containing histidine kinase [Hominibacterium faecale]